MIELRIPEGINYECTGCGKCCGGWAIPMTQPDYERISAKNWPELSSKFKDKSLFRALKDYEKDGSPYTHAIMPADDGHCPFLVDNLCFIHKSFGAEAKPAICSLFPYCFNETPSGVYATVSFNSMGVIYNSGKPLIDQRDLLESKWSEFQRLYPGHHPNWSSLKYSVGLPMTWDEYLEHEKHLLGFISERNISIEERLIKASDYLMAQLPNPPGVPAVMEKPGLNRLDKHLLAALHKIYFPVQPPRKGYGDFNLFRFAYQLAFQGTRLALPGSAYSFEQLQQMLWPHDDAEIEDLLYRYLFSRLFGKHYFGAGFGQLSLIAGFHHLVLVFALIKLQAKGHALYREAPQVSLLDVIAALRTVEKRLGETILGGYGAATYELLMTSSQRIRRVLSCT